MSEFKILQGKGQYFQGVWVNGLGPIMESINPANGTLVWQGHCATKDDIVNAYCAANQALPVWANLDFEQRAHYAQLFAQEVEKNRTRLTQLISLETGKPLWESHTEVSSVIAKITISIEAFNERTWPKETTTADAYSRLRFKPQGVVVVLGAFNFPAHLSNGHIVPALLAGNTILYKPSEQAPAVAEAIMQCWHDSGIPKGVINCLQGDATCGSAVLDQNIQGIYFTGSYTTGLKIHQQFSNRPEVILALEMGGNNPLVVADPADIKAAVYHTLLSTIITSGQRCTCARRVIIPNTKHGNEFLKQFIKACTQVKISSFDTNPEPFMGPVISYDQALKHIKKQNDLLALGGQSLLSMTLLTENTGFVTPGIIDMSSVTNPPDEEIFAPFVQIYRYDHFDDALKLANQTRYGLCAGLLSDKEEHYRLFYIALRAGLINWNRPTTGAASSLPFGGVGLSGNHRPSAFYAADYCAYPVASQEQPLLSLPKTLLPGLIV